MNDNILFWDKDSLHGEPYPKYNCIIIELPKKILDKLDRKEVKEKVENFTAEGTLPIIFYT